MDASKLEATVADNEYVGEEMDDDYQLGSAEICHFISDRLNNLDVTNFVNTRHVEKGRYVGTPAEARQDVEFYRRRKGNTEENRSNRLLCAAWIVLEMIERGQAQPGLRAQLKENHLTEASVRSCIGQSMAAYGNTMLTKATQMDTSRFVYLQALLLTNVKWNDWKNSLNRYISSFFWGQKQMEDMVKEEDRSAEPAEGIRIRDDLFTQNDPVSIPVGELVLGILQLLRVLRRNNASDIGGRLTEQLYSSGLPVAQWLEENGVPARADSYDSFNQSLWRADERLAEVEQRLTETLKTTPAQILNIEGNSQLLEQLGSPDFQQWLSHTDRDRLLTIRKILESLKGYHSSGDFQYRTGTLSGAIRDIARLTGEISEYPTQLSYDLYRPVLENIRSNLLTATNNLYKQLPPMLEITQTIPAYMDNQQNVRVHLSIQNGSDKNRGGERQRADNIILSVKAAEEGVTIVGGMESTRLSGIYGGSVQEVILSFRVTEGVLAMGSFHLVVQCDYCYSSSVTEVESDSVEFDDIIVLSRGSQEKIRNLFSGHIGNPMEDESMFYGREDEIRHLLNMIRTMDGRLNYGHGALLYGQTRAGKSSICYHFKNRLREDEGDAVILVDMGDLEEIRVDESNFFSRFLSLLELEIELNHPELHAGLVREGIENPHERALMEPAHAQFLFTGYLRRLDTRIRGSRAQSEKMIVVVIDEFSCIHTAINEGSLPPTFMRTWKAMLQNYGLFAVVFGQDDTPQFVRQHQNAFESMELVKVTCLEEGPAKKLIWQPIAIEKPGASQPESRFSDAALSELYRLTSGSAFLTIKLCSALVDYLNEMGAASVTPAIIRDFLNKKVLNSHSCFEEADFEPQIGDRGDPSCTEENKRLLLAIARASQETGRAEIAAVRCPDMAEMRKKQLIVRLEERGVIETMENRYCRIEVELLTEWLLVKYGRE